MFFRVVSTEFRKLKRSPVPPTLAVVYSLAPLMLGFMMLALKDPQLGSRLGLFTAKAEMAIGTVDWPTYLGLVRFLFAGGTIVLAVAQAYLFGREYVEGNAKNLLSLPVRRSDVVLAKLLVSAVWFASMVMLVFAESLLVGSLIRLPAYSRALLDDAVHGALILLLQSFFAGSAAAFVAVLTRGYLAPLGLSVLFLLLGDFFSHTGWGQWVPWSIVFISAGAAASGTTGLTAPMPATSLSSWVVLVLFFAGTTAATVFWVERRDQAG